MFLSETRLPLTQNGMTQLFARLKQCPGITGKRIGPHIFRHTFAIRSLILGNDPFSLQELLGHEDMSTVKNYMHMNDETLQEQKRKYSPGDHLPTRMPGRRETRSRQARRPGPGRIRYELGMCAVRRDQNGAITCLRRTTRIRKMELTTRHSRSATNPASGPKVPPVQICGPLVVEVINAFTELDPEPDIVVPKNGPSKKFQAQ